MAPEHGPDNDAPEPTRSESGAPTGADSEAAPPTPLPVRVARLAEEVRSLRTRIARLEAGPKGEQSAPQLAASAAPVEDAIAAPAPVPPAVPLPAAAPVPPVATTEYAPPQEKLAAFRRMTEALSPASAPPPPPPPPPPPAASAPLPAARPSEPAAMPPPPRPLGGHAAPGPGAPAFPGALPPPPAAWGPAPPPPSPYTSVPTPAAEVTFGPSQVVSPAPSAAPAEPFDEARLAMRVLSIVGGFLLIGGLAALGYAITPMMGPAVKLALCFAGSLGVAGLGLWTRSRNELLGQVVSAIGIAGVFLSAYAGHFAGGFAGVLPLGGALAIMALAVAAFVALAEWWRSELVAALALVFGVIATVLSATVALWPPLLALGLLALGGAAAVARNRWIRVNALAVMAAYGTLAFLLAKSGAVTFDAGNALTLLGSLALYNALFTGGQFLRGGAMASAEALESRLAAEVEDGAQRQAAGDPLLLVVPQPVLERGWSRAAIVMNTLAFNALALFVVMRTPDWEGIAWAPLALMAAVEAARLLPRSTDQRGLFGFHLIAASVLTALVSVAAFKGPMLAAAFAAQAVAFLAAVVLLPRMRLLGIFVTPLYIASGVALAASSPAPGDWPALIGPLLMLGGCFLGAPRMTGNDLPARAVDTLAATGILFRSVYSILILSTLLPFIAATGSEHGSHAVVALLATTFAVGGYQLGRASLIAGGGLSALALQLVFVGRVPEALPDLVLLISGLHLVGVLVAGEALLRHADRSGTLPRLVYGTGTVLSILTAFFAVVAWSEAPPLRAFVPGIAAVLAAAALGGRLVGFRAGAAVGATLGALAALQTMLTPDRFHLVARALVFALSLGAAGAAVLGLRRSASKGDDAADEGRWGLAVQAATVLSLILLRAVLAPEVGTPVELLTLAVSALAATAFLPRLPQIATPSAFLVLAVVWLAALVAPQAASDVPARTWLGVQLGVTALVAMGLLVLNRRGSSLATAEMAAFHVGMLSLYYLLATGQSDAVPASLLTVAWMVYGCGLLAAGLWLAMPGVRKVALAVLALGTVRVLLVDTAGLDALARALVLLAVGVSLLGAAFLYLRWVKAPPAVAPAGGTPPERPAD